MRCHFILILIFLTNLTFGQSVIIKKIKQINTITKEIYVFPKIIIQNSLTLSQKINTTLRFEVLNSDTGTSDNKIFNQVWRTKEQSPTIHDLSYEIIRNDKSLLSLSISGEGCGAYCETFTRYFTFSPRTGNKLTLDSFLNKKGLIIFADSLNVSKLRKIKAKIFEVQDTLKTKHVQNNKALLEYYTEMLSLYQYCIDSKITPENITNLEFLAKKNILKIYTDRCSAHYNMNVDELWAFEYVLNLNHWRKYLTNYGQTFVNK